MPRSVFFSFHYEDVSSFRANVVRQSWITMRDKAAFIDKSLWEEAQIKGAESVKKLIDNSLKGTSVTVVLVGTETFKRRYVKYEIFKSFTHGNAIFAVHINRIKARNEGITSKGINPLEKLALRISSDYKKIHFYELVNRKWIEFADLPSINNRKSNSNYFPRYSNCLSEFLNFESGYAGRFYKFSELFNQEYDWIVDDGYHNINDWIEMAYNKINEN